MQIAAEILGWAGMALIVAGAGFGNYLGHHCSFRAV